ncbi:MAG TPA: PAS domain S-box protein [Candidatus Udaeobacter sp.]|nr:PAS domain S-box protein [Candidatus Udaeobacter sp.]
MKRSASKPVLRHPKTELEVAIQRYVDLFEFAPIGYVSFDRVGRIQEINLAAANLLDASPSRLIGRPFALHVTNEDVGVLLNHLSRCRSSYSRVETELHLKKRNGEIILARLASSPMSSSMKDGALLYQTAIVDLTERKRFEERIQRSEERYRTLFDLVPVAVYVCDADGIIREYNRRAAELWGQEPGGNGEGPRFCGSHKIYYPDGGLMPHEECPMARALRGEKLKTEDLEIIVERPNGERRHVIPAPRVLTNIHGKIIGAINSLFDITERKCAEVAAMRLAAVVQSSHDAIAAKTLNGIITDWNQGAERTFGYKPKEIIGKSVLTLIPKDRHNEEQEILRRIRNGESLEHYETVRCRKDGQLIDVSLTISPIKGPKGEIVGVSKIARDITTQKQTERRLVEQARLLNLTNDAIIVRDQQDRVVYWNRGAEEMYGFSAKEALGKITHELLQTRHPENLEKIRKNLERDNYWSGELVHSREDGTTITVLSRWTLDRDVRGRPASILETNTDVTARKRAEQQQRALYQFAQLQYIATNVDEMHDAALDAILSAMDCQRAAILLFDKEKVMRFVAWRGLSERYRKAVEGHSPWKPNAKSPKPVCINDADIADLPKPLKSTIRSEGIRAAAFIPLVSSQKLIGKFMTYYDAPHLFTDDELKLATTIATQLAQAIEHKRDEEALRESEARLRATVEQATAGVARCDTKGRIVFANRTLCKMLGYTESELIGKRLADVTYRDDLKKPTRLFQRMIQLGKPFEVEKRYVRKDGSVLWAAVSANPVRELNGKAQSTVAVIVDITARKKVEEALQRSNEALEELVDQRTKALSVANAELKGEIERRKGLEGEILEISDREQQRLAQELHDGICQHLTAVAFMARSVGLRLKNHRVIEVKDIEKIAELVNNAATDTRNLSRALHRFDVDAAGLVEALEDLVDREMWRTPCRLEVKPSFHLDDDTVAAHLYRIAREAVINANKHAQARQIVVKLERAGQRQMVLSVTDDGVGIQKAGNGARGLGFHIMNYRARLMGGQLKVESPEKGGTRVACCLPHGRVKSNKRKKRPSEPLSAKLTKALNILV